jgi:type I restriction enzyme S subunit
VKRLPILVPHPEEQTRITIFLDHETGKIDALVEEQEWLIELRQ